jgi:arylsulfatase A-like enzyme
MRTRRLKPDNAAADCSSGVLPRGMAAFALAATAFILSGSAAFCGQETASRSAPNIVLILTDDQGYGDLSCHGNPILKTPALDRLHAQSIRLTNFHVDPTCSPTRAALLTGRYSPRTGVWHTIMGRSILRRDETTMAELFAGAGYRTGIFGKWHLGDNYPYRAMDRGFQESLVHGGGGIGQTPDAWGTSYFNPTLYHNGQWKRTEGYCTDVFFTAAMRFIEESRAADEPFFCYIPTNVPHSPYHVAEAYSRPYAAAGLSPAMAAFYGMIANFDANMDRLLRRLDETGLAQNTIVIFMTDNGTSGDGFNAGMRGRKGQVYEGGHRVPCFIRWPARLKGGFDVDQLTAHIDLLPTLLDLCDVRKPAALRFDGQSLVPLLVGLEDWAPRTLFVQSHRILHPEPWRNSAVMTDRWRLINGKELYDIRQEPGQTLNVAGDHPEVVDRLRFEYEEWYKDVSRRFGEDCHIVVGSAEENPTTLTCHDWLDPSAGQVWDQSHLRKRPRANGPWAVEVERAGRYRVTLRELPAAAKLLLPEGGAVLHTGEATHTKPIRAGATGVDFELELKPGKTRLQTWLLEMDRGKLLGSRGAYFVEVEYLGP